MDHIEEDMVSPSGGFGPVADDGYGVSYMIASDDQVPCSRESRSLAFGSLRP